MKTKRKRIYLRIILFLYFAISFAYLSLYANTAVKDVEYLKGDDFVQLFFKINKMIPIPDVFYPDKNDNTRIVMRINNVAFELKKERFTFDSSVIDTISINKNDANSYVDVEVRLKAQVNYRVFTNQKGLYIEFPRVKNLQAANKTKVDANPGLTGKTPQPSPPITPANRLNKEEPGNTANTAAPNTQRNLIKDIILREKDTNRIKFEVITTNKADFNVIPIPEIPVRLAIDFKNTRCKRINKTVDHLNVIKIRGAYNSSSVFRVVFDLLYLKNYRVSPKKGIGNENIVEVEFFNVKEKKKIMASNNVAAVKEKNESKKITEKRPTIINQNVDVSEKEIKVESAANSTIANGGNTNKEDFFDDEKSRVLGQDLDAQSESSSDPSTETAVDPLDQITTLDQTIKGGEKKYVGEPMGFNFHSADLKDVIKIIAKISGLNIVMDPGISGKVTSQLNQVPWDQALELFLKINDLDMVREGNILRIGRVDKLAAEATKRRQLREARQMDVEVEVFTKHLSFAKVGDVASLLNKQLSKRGEILQDARTNTLIITEIPDKIVELKRLIDTLDSPPLQVSIEARIVETNINYVENFGIQWGYNFIADAAYGNQTTLKFPNSIGVSGNQLGDIQTSPLFGPLGGYAVNLPAGGATSGTLFTLGNVANTFRLDMALSAMESKGKGRIISAPKTTTQNNMEASIMQGRQIPVQTLQNNTIQVIYRPAALELKVTPQITPDGHVILTLNIDNNSADFANLVNDIPPIITQSIKTTVMVEDGGTIVVGGMYKVEKSTTKEGVPVLSKIPILGSLFKNSAKRREQRELLIFVTPRIIK